jgi:transposase
MKGLLFTQGVRDFNPMAPDRLDRLAALPIMPRLKAELGRECRRLARIIDDIAEAEAEMKAQIVPSKKARQAGPASAASSLPEHVRAKVAKLFKLKSLGVHFSTVLGSEVYYRTFHNRRGVGQFIGLAPSPFQSGDMARSSSPGSGCATSPTAHSPSGSASASVIARDASGASPSSPWRASWRLRCGATWRPASFQRGPS